MFFNGIFRGLNLTKICQKVDQVKLKPLFEKYKQKFSDKKLVNYFFLIIQSDRHWNFCIFQDNQ